ncbi:MAG: DNA-packaging protein [Armatimonadetes bacterium]|nr:DNA-packaging protein [Armatimonadota bacterium]
MAKFKKGNRFWEVRSKHGRDKIFATPEILWEAAKEYFKWCDENSLEEQKVFHTAGKITKTEISKMRPYTLMGLCIFLDVSSSYFRTFKSTIQEKDIDFLTVINKIEEIIYTQKFAGAAADLLNANIIARDLGLRDHNDVDVKDNRQQESNRRADELLQKALKTIEKQKIE